MTGLAAKVPSFVIQGAFATQVFTCDNDETSY